MTIENKLKDDQVTPPVGDKPVTPPVNPSPSDEQQKKIKELEDTLREKDTKIADLETTRATIEARQRQVNDANNKKNADETLKQRISQINERRVYDPEGADTEMASLLGEIKTQSAKDAVLEAQNIISQQSTVEKLKMGVKSSNPDFDDDIVEVIMQRANILAQTGKYKTADEAIKAATDFVKSKFDGYATKKNATPSIPDGAKAEEGGNKLPETPAKDDKIPTPEEEIESRKAGLQKKIL